MTEEQHGDPSPPRPPFDEVKSKRIGRRVQRAVDFREEVFARDPESVVEPQEAAAILGVQLEDLQTQVDQGRLGSDGADGNRIIRVTDLRAAFEEDHRRREEFAEDWIRLRSQLDWDE
ncbi:MAG: hypothetical protein J2P23_00605 [Microlunatus sp.]|nr:hypothetical protein [Microlunatus sp.]